jgi:hypothetical protein
MHTYVHTHTYTHKTYTQQVIKQLSAKEGEWTSQDGLDSLKAIKVRMRRKRKRQCVFITFRLFISKLRCW